MILTWRRLRYALVWSAALCAPRLSLSQASAGADFFVLPHGPLMCRIIPATSRDSAVYLLEFAEPESPLVRSSTVAFDSTGSPLYLVMSIRENDTTGEALVVRFTPTSVGARAKLSHLQDVPSEGSDHLRRVHAAGSMEVNQQLNEAELNKARALAEWFWKRRCGRNV